jgi:hypothetical protein
MSEHGERGNGSDGRGDGNETGLEQF